jgi:hypothetical protein
MARDRARVRAELGSLVAAAGQRLGELLNMGQRATETSSSTQERFDERDADLVLD